MHQLLRSGLCPSTSFYASLLAGQTNTSCLIGRLEEPKAKGSTQAKLPVSTRPEHSQQVNIAYQPKLQVHVSRPVSCSGKEGSRHAILTAAAGWCWVLDTHTPCHPLLPNPKQNSARPSPNICASQGSEKKKQEKAKPQAQDVHGLKMHEHLPPNKLFYLSIKESMASLHRIVLGAEHEV